MNHHPATQLLAARADGAVDNHDHDRRSPSPDSDRTDQADTVLILAVAEGMLIERYKITADLARALLEHHAATTGLPLVKVAAWLSATQDLPQPGRAD
ncbi:ANTAR domain-containing protein [Kribbella sp. CA-293567]|uniref:ANTAR domain-containing protein n=1 Tax=Kribbella sp. CA-293567 TaxID=3002436 RepID=UPI0022DCE7DB|nr:ANTAR domain-containing protein [Kribbella sp. CA-293567]WBQ07913.1 ANTAR domain-containing protein [Kribbella sp. CA-293567]